MTDRVLRCSNVHTVQPLDSFMKELQQQAFQLIAFNEKIQKEVDTPVWQVNNLDDA